MSVSPSSLQGFHSSQERLQLWTRRKEDLSGAEECNIIRFKKALLECEKKAKLIRELAAAEGKHLDSVRSLQRPLKLCTDTYRTCRAQRI